MGKGLGFEEGTALEGVGKGKGMGLRYGGFQI